MAQGPRTTDRAQPGAAARLRPPARLHQRGHLVSQQDAAQTGQPGLLEVHPSILEETLS